MIETGRLRLSAWTEAEREAFRRMTADPEVMHDYEAPFSTEEADSRFDRHMAAFVRAGFGKWALRRKSDGAWLGYCGVSPIWPTLAPAPGLEIGWRMARDAWGHGYASEAARAALADIFARTDATEVLSYTLPTNVRSHAVMRRIGLRREEGRDFLYETGLTANVYVADRDAWIGAG
ncbi:MAG TPA: GNAT family N-acetyltransferase [Caulobacteraceae bacterium]|nr:GNAT family N-acetyltransferase [Caulobacteraceae bacterium]